MNEIEKYINGYTQPNVEWQPANTKGDQQLIALNSFLTYIFDFLDEDSIIIDIGMGSGIIARQLVKFEQFLSSEIKYLGVDIKLNSASLATAGIDTELITKNKAEFCIFNDLQERIEKHKEKKSVIIIRNVLHEMDIKSFSFLLHCLNQFIQVQYLLLQDMEQLPVAEFGNAPWFIHHIKKILEKLSYRHIKLLQEESRSGTLWYTIQAVKDKKSEISLANIIAFLIDLRKEQLLHIFKESENLNFYDSKNKLKLLQFQNDSYSIKRDIFRSQSVKCEVQNNNNKTYTIINWDEIVLATKNFINDNTISFDLVLGIAHGGIPIAMLINNLLKNSKLSILQKSYIKTDTTPFFIFDGDNPARSRREKLIDAFSLPTLNDKVKNVLVVDDVTTFGNTLDWAKKLLAERFGNDINLKYFTYAADINRISVSNPEIVKDLITYKKIDNFVEWMVFPWETALIS